MTRKWQARRLGTGGPENGGFRVRTTTPIIPHNRATCQPPEPTELDGLIGDALTNYYDAWDAGDLAHADRAAAVYRRAIRSRRGLLAGHRQLELYDEN